MAPSKTPGPVSVWKLSSSRPKSRHLVDDGVHQRRVERRAQPRVAEHPRRQRRQVREALLFRDWGVSLKMKNSYSAPNLGRAHVPSALAHLLKELARARLEAASRPLTKSRRKAAVSGSHG